MEPESRIRCRKFVFFSLIELPSKHYCGHGKAAEKDGDPETPGKELWEKKYGGQSWDTPGGLWTMV